MADCLFCVVFQNAMIVLVFDRKNIIGPFECAALWWHQNILKLPARHHAPKPRCYDHFVIFVTMKCVLHLLYNLESLSICSAQVRIKVWRKCIHWLSVNGLCLERHISHWMPCMSNHQTGMRKVCSSLSNLLANHGSFKSRKCLVFGIANIPSVNSIICSFQTSPQFIIIIFPGHVTVFPVTTVIVMHYTIGSQPFTSWWNLIEISIGYHTKQFMIDYW